MSMRAVVATALMATVAGCGSHSEPSRTVTVNQTTHVDVLRTTLHGADTSTGADAEGVYRADSPGVVTIISYGVGPSSSVGLGSGFVVAADGEIATNAHVVTGGTGKSLHAAKHVYVRFSDGNQVAARIVGYDPDADVALLRVPTGGLDIRPLPLGSSDGVVVGAPVMVIGSPFGEEQSLSVGVISATNRTIDSLTGFTIEGAIQTDAAINHGNSGGPLLDAHGRVLGIASQIDTSDGEGSGVGFAVPVDTVRRSLAQLRATGRVHYAFLGVRTSDVYPQLSQRFDLNAPHGAYVTSVQAHGPGAAAGLHGSSGSSTTFQGVPFRGGGDVIVAVNSTPVRQASQVASALAPLKPGDRIALHIVRDGRPLTVHATLGTRPETGTP
jgi:S1-C subfamily serine protease